MRRLGERVRSELEALRDMLNDDKIAREVVTPAHLLIQAEKLDVNEATLRYFAAAVSGAIDGDGYVSATQKEVGLTSGKHAVALLWKAALAAHGIKTEVRGTDRKLDVVASGGGAARLAGLYFLYESPMLEGDEKVINHKLAGAMELGAREVLSISWKRLRRTDKDRVVADLTISEGGAAIKVQRISAREGDRAPIPIDGPEPRGACGPPPQAGRRRRGGEEGGWQRQVVH